jgi:LuxR family transcriptional regulator/LuxR family quorum-sensing system transcriptional regulator CciR
VNQQIDLNDINEAARTADSIGLHLENFKKLTETDDIKIVNYHCLPPRGAEHNDPISMISWAGGHTEWSRMYKEKKLYRDNPFVNVTLLAGRCMLWSAIRSYQHLTAQENQFIEQFGDHYNGEGLSIPLYGPTGHNGNVCVRFQTDDFALSPTEIMKIQMINQQSHTRICYTLGRRNREDRILTNREKEVLGWVIIGKSNSVIADIMGLSKHTIDSYMRHLFLKLGASDRVTAALRGLAVGAVH